MPVQKQNWPIGHGGQVEDDATVGIDNRKCCHSNYSKSNQNFQRSAKKVASNIEENN
jgi:hypothetical protein